MLFYNNCFAKISFMNNIVFAKLLVLPPNLMIKYSNLIIVGKVVSLEQNKGEIDTVIQIQRILKGKITKKDLDIKYKIDPMYGCTQKFADAGKIVMILMRDGSFAVDKNNVAIIESGRLNLLYENSVGNYSVQDFVREYKQLYDKR